MSRDPKQPPPGVAQRLAQLAELYVPETDAEARRRLQHERPAVTRPLDEAVGHRLAELQALCDLTAQLHKR